MKGKSSKLEVRKAKLEKLHRRGLIIYDYFISIGEEPAHFEDKKQYRIKVYEKITKNADEFEKKLTNYIKGYRDAAREDNKWICEILTEEEKAELKKILQNEFGEDMM